MPAHRIALQRLLHHQRQTRKALAHFRMAGRQPDLYLQAMAFRSPPENSVDWAVCLFAGEPPDRTKLTEGYR